MSGRRQDDSRSGNEDSELFRRVLGDVEPIRKRRDRISTHDAQPVRRETTVLPRTPTDTGSAPRQAELETGAGAGVDRRSLERLRRGKLPIEDILDLHGKTYDEARLTLEGFIADASEAGQRCVLVVTGKGSVASGGGVLRRGLPQWLNRPPCRDRVLAFSPARPEHGGAGACYVLLRRRKPHQTRQNRRRGPK
ncbi:MAG: Smr/MutS family protein [Alphaproteobacteria bacterium]